MDRKLAATENTEQSRSPVDRLEGKVSLNRRQYVLLGAAAAGAVMGTGFSSAESSTDSGEVVYMTDFEEYAE